MRNYCLGTKINEGNRAMRKDFRLMSAGFVIGLCVLAAGVLHAQAVKASLPKDSKLAIVGDSITEQKQYSKFMEIYLLACAGLKDITVFQFGWSGETANGFSGRAENDLSVFKPTVVTLCYGMNDGGYRLFNDGIGGNYEKAMRTVIEKLKAMGVSVLS